MVTIPAGEFTMGSDERPNTDEKKPQWYEPEHKVDLPAYKIDVYEVTNGEWLKFINESDYKPEGYWRKYYSIGLEDRPVTAVTWNDAKAYCEFYKSHLPTEQEWEKAARGPDNFRYPWGDKWQPAECNCDEAAEHNIVDVGQYEGDKSAYGVYDMMGNAQEWTKDKLRPYPHSPARHEKVFRSGLIAVRGGAYVLRGRQLALWTRFGYLPKYVGAIGFRCAQEIKEESQNGDKK